MHLKADRVQVEVTVADSSSLLAFTLLNYTMLTGVSHLNFINILSTFLMRVLILSYK